MGQNANVRHEYAERKKCHSQGSEVWKCNGQGWCPQNLWLWARPTALILEIVALKRQMRHSLHYGSVDIFPPSGLLPQASIHFKVRHLLFIRHFSLISVWLPSFRLWHRAIKENETLQPPKKHQNVQSLP